MNYVIIDSGIVLNTIVAEKEFAQSIGAVFCGNLPISIGDRFEDNKFVKVEHEYDLEGNLLNSYEKYFDIPEEGEGNLRIREKCYETMIYKEDSSPLILWDSVAITVDQANIKWLDYSAEGNEKANELCDLIVSAKAYIRELYPDK